MAQEDKKFIFDYKKYQNKSITVEKLDKIAAIVLEAGTGKFNAIIAGIKLAFILAWLVARRMMIEQQLLIAKQEYEQDATDKNRGEIDNEDLDGH